MSFSKKKRAVVFSIAGAIVVLLICILCIAGNILTDFSIKRGASASSSISSSLNVSDNNEQVQLENTANSLKKQTQEKAWNWAKENPPEIINIKASDGINLQGYLFMNSVPTNKWAVVVHGYSSAAYWVYDFAKAYYDRGYNVLTTDMRAHGNSEGTYIGMGWLDKDDELKWLEAILSVDSDAEILMHGFSMGASTLMMLSGMKELPSNVKLIIEDSGYSSDWAEMEDKIHTVVHLPSFPFLNVASLFTKLKAGYSIKEADCIKMLKNNKTPMLHIHGDADDYNPFYMLDIVYNANACEKKQKLVVKGARHCMSAYVEPEIYWKTVESFIEEYWN